MPPFSITPKAGASIPFLERPAAASEAAKSSREKAIAAFMGGSQDSNTPGRQAAPPAPQDGFDVALAKANAAAQAAPDSPPVSETTDESGGQTITSEAATSQPAKVEETPLSQHYATLARKEKALRAEVKRLNDERAAFKAEREAATRGAVSPAATAQTPATPVKSYSQERLLDDPIGVFEELGLSTEAIAQRLLNHSPVDPRMSSYIGKLEKQIAELKAGQDETRKTLESNQTASYDQAVDNIRFEAQSLIETDPDFATIKATGQSEEVVTLIKGVFDEGLPGKFRKGTLLTVEQAARLVEDELVAQWVEQHEKLSRIEKIQKRLNTNKTPVAKPGSNPTQGSSQSATGQQMKTITNAMGATGKTLSARDRAIAVFNGTKTG
jgi:hypothetical protein